MLGSISLPYARAINLSWDILEENMYFKYILISKEGFRNYFVRQPTAFPNGKRKLYLISPKFMTFEAFFKYFIKC